MLRGYSKQVRRSVTIDFHSLQAPTAYLSESSSAGRKVGGEVVPRNRLDSSDRLTELVWHSESGRLTSTRSCSGRRHPTAGSFVENRHVGQIHFVEVLPWRRPRADLNSAEHDLEFTIFKRNVLDGIKYSTRDQRC